MLTLACYLPLTVSERWIFTWLITTSKAEADSYLMICGDIDTELKTFLVEEYTSERKQTNSEMRIAPRNPWHGG